MFDSLALSEEDRTRTEMYRAEASRRADREQVSSVEDYLRSLQMVATVGLARAEHLPRLSQLTAKTNQFNLTTRRHDLAKLKSFSADPAAGLIWMELTDRFGSSGVVGCAAVLVDGELATIDTLLLSCRVIGRGAENVMVARLGELAAQLGASTLIGEYIPSARNAQVAGFYERLGFVGSPVADRASAVDLGPRRRVASGPRLVRDHRSRLLIQDWPSQRPCALRGRDDAARGNERRTGSAKPSGNQPALRRPVRFISGAERGQRAQAVVGCGSPASSSSVGASVSALCAVSPASEARTTSTAIERS